MLVVRSRSLRVAVAVVVVALAASVVVLLSHRAVTPAPAVAQAPAAASATHPPAQAQADPAGVPAPATPPGAAPHLCGYGPFSPTPAEPFLPSKVEKQANAALETLAQRLQSDEASRVAGLALLLAVRRTQPEATGHAPGSGAEPSADHGALAMQLKQREQRSATERAALVRWAQATRDAHAYQLAFFACHALLSADEHCNGVNAAEWARRDPTNGLAWLYAIGEARDAAALEHAVYQLSQASDLRGSWNSMVALIDHPVLQQQPQATQTATTLLLATLQASEPLPRYSPLAQHCAKERVAADAFRKERCGEIARLLVTRGTTLLDLSIGLMLAERVGWPSAELARWRQELDASRRAAQLEGNAFEAALGSCTAYEDWRKGLQAQARGGERALLLHRLQAAGIDPAAAAEHWRSQQRITEQRLSEQRSKAQPAQQDGSTTSMSDTSRGGGGATNAAPVDGSTNASKSPGAR